jgi:hypothetical protein
MDALDRTGPWHLSDVKGVRFENGGTELGNYYAFLYDPMEAIAQSAQRLTTGWTVRGSIPGRGEIFRVCPDRPWDPSSLLYNGYRVLPRG